MTTPLDTLLDPSFPIPGEAIPYSPADATVDVLFWLTAIQPTPVLFPAPGDAPAGMVTRVPIREPGPQALSQNLSGNEPMWLGAVQRAPTGGVHGRLLPAAPFESGTVAAAEAVGWSPWPGYPPPAPDPAYGPRGVPPRASLRRGPRDPGFGMRTPSEEMHLAFRRLGCDVLATPFDDLVDEENVEAAVTPRGPVQRSGAVLLHQLVQDGPRSGEPAGMS